MRLCETDPNGTTATFGSYACLSHCWGSVGHGSAILRTTRTTLAAYKEAIPLESLPRTFHEAIQFTRALGIPYLWIDSLCIIQDDKLDWEKEAAAMADIYMNCYVSLAASLSSDSEGGLFAKPDVGICQVGVVRRSDSSSCPLYMREAPEHDVEDMCYPLATRGWVVQETLLSPRTFSFVGTEIIFECQQGVQCECGECGELYGIKSGKASFADAEHWRDIVQRFTATSLSFGRDTLPALSGFAKRWLVVRPDDTYLAGLWRSTLLLDILWSTEEASRARPWRAPSWSWASVDTNDWLIQFRMHDDDAKDFEFLVEVVDVHCTSSGADPTGTVAFGHLVLRGKAFDASIGYAHDKATRFHDSSDDGSIEHEGDMVTWSMDTPDPCCAFVEIGRVKTMCHMDFAPWNLGRDHIVEGSAVKLLFITRKPHVTVLRGKGWFGLILKPLYANTYERIGFIEGGNLSLRFKEDESLLLASGQVFDETPVADYFIV
jgi:hypothetical protein